MQTQCKTDATAIHFQSKFIAKPMQIPCKFNCNSRNQCTSNANPSPCPSVWPLVGISKHWRENSTLLAYNQKPQPQLGQNVQALRRGLRQILQPWVLAGPEPYCPSFGCGFWLNASNFEFPRLCFEIPTRPKNPPLQIQYNVKAKTMPVQCKFNPNSMQK